MYAKGKKINYYYYYYYYYYPEIHGDAKLKCTFQTFEQKLASREEARCEIAIALCISRCFCRMEDI